MSEASQLGPSQNGSVVLDIGGDIGALILLTDEDLLGAEIEISPVTAPDAHESPGVHTHDHDGQGYQHGHAHAHNVYHGNTRTHVAVRERRGPGGSQYAAIFFGLRAGEYQLWDVHGEPADTVRIVGGHVAELDWR